VTIETASRAEGDTRRTARRGLGIYFAVVVVLSTAIEAFIISRPDIDGPRVLARAMDDPPQAGEKLKGRRLQQAFAPEEPEA
jgi:hypothetical protein